MITKHQLQELLSYDPDTGVFTQIKARQKVRVGDVAGGVKNHGYVVIKINGKFYQAHRLAWLYVYGEFPIDALDHINRIRNDNRICNLRLATNADNVQNKSVFRNNTSGSTGVTWDKRSKKWKAYISVRREKTILGYFTNICDAVAARKAADPKFHPFKPSDTHHG